MQLKKRQHSKHSSLTIRLKFKFLIHFKEKTIFDFASCLNAIIFLFKKDFLKNFPAKDRRLLFLTASLKSLHRNKLLKTSLSDVLLPDFFLLLANSFLEIDLKLSPNWIPAIKDGNPVRCLYCLPFYVQ